MAKPLISEEPGQPKDMQFAHFGVLDAGTQSKASTITSVTINVLLAFVIIVIGAATKKSIDNRRKLTELTEPVMIKKVEPVKPKVVPPTPPPPKLPEVPKVVMEAPKIIVPEKVPEPPKPIVMDQPKPVILPPVAAPKVVAAAAPAVVNLAAKPASVVNNDAHPEAVRLGNQTSAVNPTTGPTVSSVNLARGMAGMNSANTGNGPAATHINMGSGSPSGTSTHGGIQAVSGLSGGVAGGTGTGRTASSVNLAAAPPPPMAKGPTAVSTAQAKEPKVVWKPNPEYTAEARQLHLEGTVRVHIHVLPNGSVQVVGVVNSLGHGLDEAAERTAAATKFDPATDASGHPIEWDGYETVTFQLAG
jgi:protein TonB